MQRHAVTDLLHAGRYGFIVMDGNGSLFGTLSGNTREVLHKFTVDLPKKHGRGGQSALRFARLRMEKRHNYVRKVRGPSSCQSAGRRVMLAQSSPASNAADTDVSSMLALLHDLQLVQPI